MCRECEDLSAVSPSRPEPEKTYSQATTSPRERGGSSVLTSRTRDWALEGNGTGTLSTPVCQRADFGSVRVSLLTKVHAAKDTATATTRLLGLRPMLRGGPQQQSVARSALPL